MLRNKHKAEAAIRLAIKPPSGFLGDMRRVVVEDDFDGGIRRIGGVHFLEKRDKFPRAMAIFNTGMNVPRAQVDAGQ